MATITALTAQKRNPDRLNVYLDGKFAFGLAIDAASGLKVDQVLDEAAIAHLQALDGVEKARDTAVNLLTYRPRSVAEVKRHLRQKKIDDEIIAKVIVRLEAANLLDDRAFAAYWVEQRETFKPRSRLALRHELGQKGVSRDVIDEAVSQVDETTAARRAAEKQAYRWANLPEGAFRLKLGSFLQRRGFRYETIREITKETWQTLIEEGD